MRIRSSVVIAAIVFCVVCTSYANAQSCRHDGACNVTINRTLDFEDGTCLDEATRRYDFFVFSPPLGSKITASVQSAFFVPAVELITPSNVLAETDANSAAKPTASVEHVVGEVGVWSVKVRNIEIGAGGPYTLKITCGAINENNPPGLVLGSTPISMTVQPPADRTIRVTGVTVGGATPPITIRLDNLPVGVTAEPTRATLPISGTTDFQIRVAPDAPGGLFSLVFTGSTEAGETSAASTVLTIDAPCRPPAIYQQPTSISVPRGGSALLSLVSKGTPPLTYQWYQGIPGRTTYPVASSADLLTPAVTEPTSFWARIANRCGSIDTAAAIVTPVEAAGRRRSVRH